MLDHMSSSGVMHGDGRQCGEEKVKHESKKRDIAAVHVRYRNNYAYKNNKAYKDEAKIQHYLPNTSNTPVSLTKMQPNVFHLLNLRTTL